MSRRDDLIEKHASKVGLRGKIDAHCISCVYDETQAGYWGKQVELCTVVSCPLFSVRKGASKAVSECSTGQIDIEEVIE